MPRKKGSKNLSVRGKKNETGYADRITQLEADLTASDERITALTDVIAKQKSELFAEKKIHKQLAKKLTTLKGRQAQLESQAAAEAKKAEAEKLVAELLASGKTADEIMNLLKD